MALDADIAAAATTLDLEKIKAQDYRNDLKARLPLAQQQVENDSKKTLEIASMVSLQQDVAGGLLSPQQEIRLAIVRAIGANYMKPTTGTLPGTIAADIENDSTRLRAAVDAVYKIVIGSPDAGSA